MLSFKEYECVNKPNSFLIKVTRIVHEGLQELPTKILDVLLVVKKILVPYVAICVFLSVKALVGIVVFHGCVAIRKVGCLLFISVFIVMHSGSASNVSHMTDK